eukprot:TRINITY_DN1030_c0_g1_i1.p1 TRINITY_DN1030_c0_g1~~TRINITY_DN1030_c0_g1_i1.p1  ORF type:complete len:306 (-),score=50.62 TRINITY_DN1030_c0_g1_i1:561-1415(-)
MAEPAWVQPFACFVLAALYTLIAVVTLLLMLRTIARVRVLGLQNVFYLLVIAFCILRAISYFCLATSGLPSIAFYILWSIPGDLLFSTYWLLVFYWSMSYAHTHGHYGEDGDRSAKIRVGVLVSANVILYAVQVAFFGVAAAGSTLFIDLQPYFFSVVALLSVVAFVLVGGLVIFYTRSSNVQSTLRRRKMQQVFAIVIIVSIAFVLRAIVNFMWPDVVDHVIAHDGYYWAFVLPFYLIVEVLPTLSVVVLVTRIPPRVHTLKSSTRVTTSTDGMQPLLRTADI